MNAVVQMNTDPAKSVDVLSYGLVLGLPAFEIFGGRMKLPSLLVGATDNQTITVPTRKDATPGGGGQALGKNAGVSVKLGIDNPLIPGLVAEYNVQAKLIESIFMPNAKDPITTESILLRSPVGF
jgi:hypothetical protein